MALIAPSALISSISGSIDGTTFRQTRSGILATKRRRPTPTSSRFALDAHAAYALALNTFRSLDAPARLAWQTAARMYNRRNRIGLSAPASPWSLFLEANAFYFHWNFTLYATLATYTRYPGPQYVLAYWNPGTATLLAPYPEVESVPPWITIVNARRTCSSRLSPPSGPMVLCPNAYWFKMGLENWYLDPWPDITARQGPPVLGEMIVVSVQYTAPGFLPSTPVYSTWPVGPDPQPKPGAES